MKAFEPVKEECSIPLFRDEEASTEYRNQGYKLMVQGKFFEALESFNKSLCTAQLGSKEITLAFAGRASAYLETKCYEKCLENIELARNSGFTAEKDEMLNFLDRKCRRSMENQTKPDDESLWSFFKLSHPPNPKIPFIINSLELHNSKEFGRLIITNQGQIPISSLFEVLQRFFPNRFETWRRDCN
jgi:SET and MYND domain-containing protein 4